MCKRMCANECSVPTRCKNVGECRYHLNEYKEYWEKTTDLLIPFPVLYYTRSIQFCIPKVIRRRFKWNNPPWLSDLEGILNLNSSRMFMTAYKRVKFRRYALCPERLDIIPEWENIEWDQDWMAVLTKSVQ